MAFSFRAGTNWCHDFPKLARESGFYFNMHRTRVRVDWNRISTIDIDRVIHDRDFFTIDDNINNVVDYHLETEYDVKILDPNFVKLFRLAQLSVEYLLYCKQYLDQSVIILKDELRLKLEENVRLKKELTISENNMKELKEKFRDKYKFIEKRFSDSHGEIHKCPFCPKTFIADVFMNSHITRRHSNASQLSVTSPVHEQYKAEAEKLHHEIKTLKERLNETERVIRSESVKFCDSTELNKDKYNNIKNGEYEIIDNAKDKRLEEEHKKYRDEMSHFKTMLFSEIRSLKQDEKKSIHQNELTNENIKELLKQQENEIHRLHDQLRQLSMKKSTSDMETIQAQLNAQEDFWQSKIEKLESQHRDDIETLYKQLKMTQASADFVKSDYINKIKELEKFRNDEMKSLANSSSSIGEIKRFQEQDHIDKPEQRQIEIFNRKIPPIDKINSTIIEHNSDRIIIEDVDKISDTDMINIPTSVNKLRRITVNTINSDADSTEIHVKENSKTKKLHASKSPRHNFQLSNQQKKINDERSDVDVRVMSNKSNLEHNTQAIKSKENVTHPMNVHNKMDLLSSQSEESSSRSESTSESKTSESDQSNKSNSVYSHSSTEEETIENSEDKQFVIDTRLKSNDELKIEIREALEQKLRDLGVDPEWDKIPNATYRQLIDTVRHHRSINSKKYNKFDNIRRKIMKQMADKIFTYQNDRVNLSVNDAAKKSYWDKLITNVASKTFKALSIQNHHSFHTPKLKSPIISSHEKSVSNKFNIELLPKKLNQLEFQEIKSPTARQSQLLKSHTSRNENVAMQSPVNDRYTSSPSRLNAKSTESIDMKHLSHSYESIKDFMKDSNYGYKRVNSSLNVGGNIVTSTPQRDYSNISSHKTITADISSHIPNSELFISSLNSPKNNKSVLKSTTGSTGSLVKKKVLFDLQAIESFSDKITESRDKCTDKVNRINDGESESDFDISNISEGNPNELQINQSTNSDKIILRTSQSEKIAEISKKIESELNLIRHKPLGGIQTMFARGFMENEQGLKANTGNEFMSSYKDNARKLSVNNPVIKLPQPTPRTPKLTLRSVSPDYKSDTKDSNLDMDIEELLRED
ncbi:hypothetical protein PV326_009756 [Microctonus aethiopoides]|nr:hypothetical protein PV326_009756 [Microctonus aethiopoides]